MTAEAKLSFQVYWYPNANVNFSPDSPPYVGVINQAWSKGVASISCLPADDGAVICKDQVYHKDDPRLFDGMGRPRPVVAERGCWDYTETSKFLLEMMGQSDAIGKTDEPEEAEVKKKPGRPRKESAQ